VFLPTIHWPVYIFRLPVFRYNRRIGHLIKIAEIDRNNIVLVRDGAISAFDFLVNE
jgi:hypothetical protein